MTKAYIASPLFNDEQNAHITEIEKLCKDNHIGFYSPRDIEISKYYATLNENSPKFNINLAKNLIFVENIKGILDSDVVFVNPKGNDSGTFFECGFALSRNKPIICTQPELEASFSELISKFKSKIYESMRAHNLPYSTICCDGDSFYVKDNTSTHCTVIAEDSDKPYCAISKLVIGFLHGLNVPVIDYIDRPRKSNLMLSSCVNVFEVHNEHKLNEFTTAYDSTDIVRKVGCKDE